MKREHIEPLPREIAALLASERLSSVPGPAERAMIWSRVESAVGPVAGGAAAAGIGAKIAAVVAAALVGGSAAAVWVFFQSRATEPVAVAPPAKVPSAVVPLAPLPDPFVDSEAPAPVQPSQPAKAAPRARQATPTLAAERALLLSAREALARGDSRSALDALARHPREFPRGQLAEEREALWVLALVRAGRTAEARTRGEAFLARFARSIQRPVVESALASIP